MTGRVAIVTGGTRGIGGAISEALAQAGYKVAANYVGSTDRAKSFQERTGIMTVRFDVGDFEASREGVKRIEQELGPVEVLVNNAGITRDGTLHKMSFEAWDEVMRTNLTSCFNMCRHVIEGMRDRKFGRIVNIGSVNGQAGQYGQVNYAAAKAGLHGFTRALALESASRGITVNLIAPGSIDSGQMRDMPDQVISKIEAKIPVGRLGRPEDIARGVLFLTADDADFITGTILAINGGQHMS